MILTGKTDIAAAMRKLGDVQKDETKTSLMLVCTDGENSGGPKPVVNARDDLLDKDWIIYAVGMDFICFQTRSPETLTHFF